MATICTRETIARIITIAFSVIMAIKLDNKMGKIGLIVYIIGFLIYFCSYFIVIKAPEFFLKILFIKY